MLIAGETRGMFILGRPESCLCCADQSHVCSWGDQSHVCSWGDQRHVYRQEGKPEAPFQASGISPF